MRRTPPPTPPKKHWLIKPKNFLPIIGIIIAGLFGWGNNWFNSPPQAVSINPSGNAKTAVNTGLGTQHNDFGDKHNDPVTIKSTIVESPNISKESRLVFAGMKYDFIPFKRGSDSTGLLFDLKNIGNDLAKHIKATTVTAYYKNSIHSLSPCVTQKVNDYMDIAPNTPISAVINFHNPNERDSVFFYVKMEYTNSLKEKMTPLRQIFFYANGYWGKDLPVADPKDFDKIAILLKNKGCW